MSSIRVFAAGAALMLFSGLTAGGALAQAPTDQTPGKPLQLLQWLHTTAQSSEPKVRPRTKIAERKIAHTATSVAKHRRSPVETAEATPQATVWAPLNAVPSEFDNDSGNGRTRHRDGIGARQPSPE